MNKVFILGAFGYYNNQLDGQTIKTRNVYDLIKKNYEGDVSFIDTLTVRKKPWIMFKMLWEMLRCKKLVIVPCTNNLDLIFPFAYYLSKLFSFEIIHICIGGWQVEYFLGSTIKVQDGEMLSGNKRNYNKPRWTPHPLQMKLNKKIKVIMPEMITEVKELEDLGFNNVEFFPNFRLANPISMISFNLDDTSELRLVFMARIMKMKGYETVFDFADYARKNNMKVRIDFYGQINSDEEKYFISLVKAHENTSYCGYLAPDEITKVLMNYDMMMLPTRFYTESLPGTVLDSFIAGIPIIATNWKYAKEFIEDGKTGFIVPFEDSQSEFNRKLTIVYHDREKLKCMKEYASNEAIKYSEHTAWQRIKKYLYD